MAKSIKRKPELKSKVSMPLEAVQKHTQNVPRPRTPDMILEVASEKGRTLEEISKFMDLYDRLKADMAKAAFKQAAIVFQHEVPDIRKSTNVNYTTKDGKVVTYNYASLGDIGFSIKEACFKSGLSYSWEMDDSGPKIKVTCVISHIEGHEVRATMEANADTSGGKNEIQSRASTITYLQRYTLISALGLTTADTDVDGQGTREVQPEVVYDDSKHKKSVTAEAYKAYVTAINAGKTTLEEIRANCWLTPDQDEALQAVQRIRDEKVAKGL